MALRASARRSSRSFIPKTEQGDFVHVKDGDRKITGTVISKSDTEIVVSERGKDGAPQLHVINVNKDDVIVAPTKTAKMTYRNDASGFVDPFRKRSLTSEMSLIKTQNALDFSVQGYDVKKDEFYIEGRLNAGSPFGKWVSAKDLIPLMDVHARGGVTSPDELIRTFANKIGQGGTLTDRPKETPEPPKEDAKEKTAEVDTVKNESPSSGVTQDARALEQEQNDSEEPQTEQVSASLIEKLKTLREQPSANEVSPEPKKKTASREDLKSTKEYVQERLNLLRGKTSGSSSGAEGIASGAQAARDAVVLGDVAFTSGAAVPALVLAYATAGAGRTPEANQADWQNALRQMEGLSQELNTRLSERRAQFEVLSMASAPSALLEESRSRVSALETAGQTAMQTLESARGRRSAQEFAGLQTAPLSTARTGGGSLGDAQSVQSTVNVLRAQGGIPKSGGGNASQSVQRQTASTLGTDLTKALEQEIAFESGTQQAIQNQLQSLQTRIKNLQNQIADTQSSGEGLQVGLEQAIASAESALQTLETARQAQGERLEQAQQALAQAQEIIAALPTQETPSSFSGATSSTPSGTQAVQTILQGGGGGGGTGAAGTSSTRTEGAAPPSVDDIGARPKGSPTGTPGVPPLRSGQGGTAGATGFGGGNAGKPTTTLGARSITPGSIPSIRPLPLRSAASEFATLDRDRQMADTNDSVPSMRGGRRRRAVTDVPQMAYDEPDEDDEGEEGDNGEPEEGSEEAWRDEMADQQASADQFQNNEGGGDGEEGEELSENDIQDVSSGSESQESGAESPASQGPRSEFEEGLENFRQLASAKALIARSEAARAQATGRATAAKIATAKRKRLEAIEKEIEQKGLDIASLGGFEAIIPVLKYLGTIFISAVNRKAGAFSLQILPGYRPELPKGTQPDKLEQKWDLLLMIELCAVVIGMIAAFLLFIGFMVIMFFYFFGPIIGILTTFCSALGSVCRAAANAAANVASAIH